MGEIRKQATRTSVRLGETEEHGDAVMEFIPFLLLSFQGEASDIAKLEQWSAVPIQV
jgi:hypothetical protein